VRLFVSVDLPDALADEVAAVQSWFDDVPGVRTTDPTQAHVTLAFLGDVDETRVPAVEDTLRDAVGEAGVAPFEATVVGLGVFPSEDYVTVVWVGFDDGREELTALHRAVRPALEGLGFEFEDRAFTPHVTVARVDHGGGKAEIQRLLAERNPTVGTFRASEVCLTESVLGGDGPTYETVAAVGL